MYPYKINLQNSKPIRLCLKHLNQQVEKHHPETKDGTSTNLSHFWTINHLQFGQSNVDVLLFQVAALWVRHARNSRRPSMNLVTVIEILKRKVVGSYDGL